MGTVCMIQALTAGCGLDTASSERMEEEAARQESDSAPSDDESKDSGESGEQGESKWHVLDQDTAAVLDADFIGKVWKIEEDSFFIAETKVKILDDGSRVRNSPSSHAKLSDDQLIQVIFDEDTYFYIRIMEESRDGNQDEQAGFMDLEEHMPVEMKGRFENDIFYADEVRMMKSS